jgi:hypothetical protein
MNNIPTAEEFFEQGGTYPELAIKFAKLHVKAALEAADKKAEQEIPEGFWDYAEDKNFILNAYSLENIK